MSHTEEYTHIYKIMQNYSSILLRHICVVCMCTCIFEFACVCVHRDIVHVYMGIQECGWVHICIQHDKTILGIISQLPIHLLRQGPTVASTFAEQAKLAFRDPPVCMPHLAITEITNTCHYTQLLPWDLGNLIHALTFAREALCQLGHLCSLYTIIFGFNISMFYTEEEIG